MLKVLDLFAGCGGLSSGFRRAGFEVYGVDVNRYSEKIFQINKIGIMKVADLREEKIQGKYDLVIGGPPCRPWSSVNLHRRRHRHPDFSLLEVFFEHVRRLKPAMFIMENVPPVRRDAERLAVDLRGDYSVRTRVFRYSDFGAPTRRKRLFMVGFRKDLVLFPDEFFVVMDKFRRPPATVRDAIGRDFDDPEHVFPELKTIHRYLEYYRTGKYGWYILRWDEPAPSFGNVMKTYILHPDSLNGSSPRVISVREALCIMGFPQSFRFPEGMPLGMRYQMVADAVSPVFSEVLAKVVREVLW